MAWRHSQHLANFAEFTVLVLLVANSLAGLFYLNKLVCPVERQADGTALFADGLKNCLANPPDGIGNKVVALFHVKVVYCGKEANVSFAYQIRKVKTVALVLLCNIHNKAQVCTNNLVFCGLVASLCL